MHKFNIDLLHYQEILNLKLGCYHPVKKFMDKENFLSVIKKFKLKNNSFFPMPIYLDIDSNQKKILEKRKKIKIFYKKKYVGLFFNCKCFKLEKKSILKEFFKTKKISHPGVRNFLATKEYFVSGDIKLSKNLNFDEKNYPKYWKELFKNKKLKKIGSFHTRNIPHKTHEWIIEKIKKICGNILIHPMTGKLKKGDFKSNCIVKAFKTLKKIKKSDKILISQFKSFARYAGPREAIFHAIIRKNFGCSHFYVGRDHAGVGKFYKKYESQRICKKYQKKIGINILALKEPGYCLKCKRVTGEDDFCSHKNELKKFLSGTDLRKLIILKKKIPEFFVRKEIAANLNLNSIRL